MYVCMYAYIPVIGKIIRQTELLITCLGEGKTLHSVTEEFCKKNLSHICVPFFCN